MKTTGILLSIFLLLFFFIGCSKDEDSIAELEKDAIESQETDYAKNAAADETISPMTEAPKTDEQLMSPETTPEEKVIDMPSQSASGGYTVQVAAGTNPVFVRELATRFIDRGFDAFVTETIINGETFYRIRIGNFATITEAKNAGMDIRDKYSTEFWIDNNM